MRVSTFFDTMVSTKKSFNKKEYSHMNIVSLFDTLLTSIFDAEQSFFENPKNFSELESSVKSSTDAFAAGFLGAIFSEISPPIHE